MVFPFQSLMVGEQGLNHLLTFIYIDIEPSRSIREFLTLPQFHLSGFPRASDHPALLP
jgi:hypothetical protein